MTPSWRKLKAVAHTHVVSAKKLAPLLLEFFGGLTPFFIAFSMR